MLEDRTGYGDLGSWVRCCVDRWGRAVSTESADGIIVSLRSLRETWRPTQNLPRTERGAACWPVDSKSTMCFGSTVELGPLVRAFHHERFFVEARGDRIHELVEIPA